MTGKEAQGAHLYPSVSSRPYDEARFDACSFASVSNVSGWRREGGGGGAAQQ